MLMMEQDVFAHNVIQILFKMVLVVVNYVPFICHLVCNALLKIFALIVIIQSFTI